MYESFYTSTYFKKYELPYCSMLIGTQKYPALSLLSYILGQIINYTDTCVFRYHEACDNARNKVLELLRGLSSELQDKINILVFCSTLLIIAKALFGHVR